MKHLALILGLVVSCLVVAVVNVLLAIYLNFNLFTLTFWFVFPAGALICGIAGSSGGIFAAYLVNHRPKIVDAVSMIACAVGTMFLIYYLDYRTLVIDEAGAKASDVVSFGKFVEIVTTKTKHQARVHHRPVGEAYEVGDFGYAYLLLYFGGFVAGGYGSFKILLKARRCLKCDSYMRRLKAKTTPPLSLEEIQATHYTIKNGSFDEAISALRWRPVKRKDNRYLYKFCMDQKIKVCPRCHTQLLECSILNRTEKEGYWAAMPEFHFHRDIPDGLSLRGVLPEKEFSTTQLPLPNEKK